MYGAIESGAAPRSWAVRMPRIPAAALLPLLLGITAVSVAALFVATRRPAPAALALYPPATPTAVPSDGDMKVYVTGAVLHPGVYAVHAGDRVVDAIEAAGGPADDADTVAVNLARRLRDEDRIVVPRRGEPGQADDAGITASGRTDLNTAPAAILESLPGIGPTRAQRIVESRQKDGPFTEPADLVKRKLVPQSVFDGLKDLVDARP